MFIATSQILIRFIYQNRFYMLLWWLWVFNYI